MRVLFILLFPLYLYAPGVRFCEVLTLSSIINAECGICPEDEKYLVGSVVLNRRDSPVYANNIQGVVAQRRQFDGFESEHYYPSDLDIAYNLILGVNRNREVMYFYRDDANHTFKRQMRDRVIIRKKFHNYAK
jgi:hypothetical protein